MTVVIQSSGTATIKRMLAGILLLSSILASSDAIADLATASAGQLGQSGLGGKEKDAGSDERYLAQFRAAPLSLTQAIAVAERLHHGSRTAAVTFEIFDRPGYRVRTVRNKQIWENVIDVITGRAIARAILWNAANPYAANVFNETERAARTLRIALQSLQVRGPEDFDTAFEAAKVQHPEGLITVEDPLTVGYRKQIVDFAARNRLPAIHGVREFVEAGGLIAYGASLSDLSRRAATYVDKILRGAKPADLPVQQPTKFEFVVNLSAAKALGLTIPRTLLARAEVPHGYLRHLAGVN